MLPPSPSLADDGSPRHFVFVLLDGFTLMSFAGAVETLRLANRLSGRTLYRWTLLGEGGGRRTCSAGVAFDLDGDLPEKLPRDATVLVCGGVDVARATTKGLLAWLRRVARWGHAVGGLCTGAWSLAQAGLLDGRRTALHWENRDGFAEAFPEVDLTWQVFVSDAQRPSSAGGTASVDLMLSLVAEAHGPDLATGVADQLVHASIRSDRDNQRLSTPARMGVRHPKLTEVVKRMEAHVEDPISPAVLAREAGLSARQLERLFRRYLDRSPKKYYMDLRLGRARNLLMQTEMSMIDVALACGFTSPSHFSKCYRARYGTTPYRERGANAAKSP